MKMDDLTDIVIRSTVINDVDSLIQLRLDFLADSFREMSAKEQNNLSRQLKKYFSNHLGTDLFVVIACMRKQVLSVAFLVIDERPANLSFPTGRLGTILNVYTVPHYRGNGLATRVMQQLLAIAKTQNVSRIDLKATPSGKPLYKKFGFEESGQDLVHMSLKSL